MTPPREQTPEARAAATALVVVPARLGSTRLPRKMLLEAAGVPLVVHTARNAGRARGVARVVVATDAEEIQRVVEAAGIEAVRTSPAHPSGTDRVHEAVEILAARGEGPFEVVVDVQGDEPELPPGHLERLIALFADPSVEVATLAAPLESEAELHDPAVAKVVRDAAGAALYFSRAPIPSRDHPGARAADGGPPPLGLRHIGVYAFRPEALARLSALPPSVLERTEALEQLRWLEAGQRVHCPVVDRVAPGIDTREHFEAFRARVEVQSEALPEGSGTP